LRKEGLNAFKLQVIPITSKNSYTKSYELCLEQYFLLDPKFNLNTLRPPAAFGWRVGGAFVVNKISGVPCFSLLKRMKNNYQPLLLSNGVSLIQRISLNKRFYSNNLPPVALYVPRTYSTNSPVVPVKIYANADKEKLQIISENKGKAGVYR